MSSIIPSQQWIRDIERLGDSPDVANKIPPMATRGRIEWLFLKVPFVKLVTITEGFNPGEVSVLLHLDRDPMLCGPEFAANLADFSRWVGEHQIPFGVEFEVSVAMPTGNCRVL